MNWSDPVWVGAIGQWVGSLASFLAVIVALGIALDSNRRERKREEEANKPNVVLTELKWSVDDTITLKFFNAGRTPCTVGRISFVLFPASGSLLKSKNSMMVTADTLYPGNFSQKVFKFYEGAVFYGENRYVSDAHLPHDNKVVYFEYGRSFPLSEYSSEYGFMGDTQMYLIGTRKLTMIEELARKTSKNYRFREKCRQMSLSILEKRRGKKKNFEDTFNDAIKDGYVFLMHFPFRTSSTIDSSMGDLVKIDKQQVERMKGIPEIEFASGYIIKFPLKVKIKDNALLFSNGKSVVFKNNDFQVT